MYADLTLATDDICRGVTIRWTSRLLEEDFLYAHILPFLGATIVRAQALFPPHYSLPLSESVHNEASGLGMEDDSQLLLPGPDSHKHVVCTQEPFCQSLFVIIVTCKRLKIMPIYKRVPACKPHVCGSPAPKGLRIIQGLVT